MAGQAGRLIAAILALGGVAAGARVVAAAQAQGGTAAALAGRYSSHFRNGLVDGSEYRSDNVAEIVPVDPTHAYVRFSLQFYNGHSCGLSGVARAEGDALVYKGPPEDNFDGMPPCRLVIRREGADLAWDDGEGPCKAHCGARGSFLHDGLPWKSRRPIRYLARLRASTEYRDAVAAWRGAR